MRKLIILFIPLLIVSCMSKENSRSDSRFLPEKVDFSTENLIEKKFKEFYDLNTLLKNYPQFKESIENRIDNFTTGERRIFEINDSITILNIRQKGAFIKVSDSVDMTHVLFDIINDTQIKTDSVVAFITKKKVLIDDEEVTSSKVKFTRVVIQDF